jgi:hypothetical protein
VPESVKIAFHSFSDIRNPGTYATSNRDQKLKGKGKVQALPILPFSLTEWWNFGEGVVMKEPFDVRDELIAGLLRALKMVCTLFHFQILEVTGAAAASWFKTSC